MVPIKSYDIVSSRTRLFGLILFSIHVPRVLATFGSSVEICDLPPCELVVQSRLTSERCGRAASRGWPLLITGTPRSATVYATNLLQSHGMQVQNDWANPKRHGSVSWIFAFEDNNNFGPARTYGRTFDTIFHQIKEPLGSITSMCTEPVLTGELNFLQRHILLESSREGSVYRSRATLEFWVEWQTFLQKMRFPTYQIEQVEPRDIFRLAHLQQYYHERSDRVSSSTNSRKHRNKFTWQELYTIDPKYAAEAWDLAHYYGYSYPDVNFDTLTCLDYLPRCDNAPPVQSSKCPPGTHPSTPSLKNMTSVSRPVGVNGVKGWVDVGCMEYKKRDGTFLGITGVKREDDPDVTDEFVDQLLQRQEQTLLPSQNSQPSSAPTTTDPTLLSTSTSVSVRYDPTLLSESTSVKLNLEPSSNSMWILTILSLTIAAVLLCGRKWHKLCCRKWHRYFYRQVPLDETEIENCAVPEDDSIEMKIIPVSSVQY
uniref:Uncharacterized protein n=1 Tax=Corethron hystrix TaxID=216773 RepID=A0A7S1BHU8_9STRA|mmetsp:Transcript_26655/g.61317  ORF Transcript_26655/g.61317 Transcript_26655/m.61317 type:complete len:484 (+) Transcript_26655:255-1706(+)